MSSIYIQHKNESTVQVQAEQGIIKEFQQLFSFDIEKKRFHPLVRAGAWDGVIRLLDSKGNFPKGLVPELLKYCVGSDYSISVSPEFKRFKEVVNFDESTLNLKFPMYDYQVDAVNRVLSKKRQIIQSPTGSGKSLIIAALLRTLNVKSLLIVPNLSLLSQIRSDLIDYFGHSGWDVDEHCTFIGDGAKKVKTNQFIISTWQSLQNLPQDWFNEFKLVLTDEVHLATSNQITKIINHCQNAFWRVGLTGTLDNSKTNEMCLVGLFGPVYKVITTKQLMNDGKVSNVIIKPIVLKYEESICKSVRGLDYDSELAVIIKNKTRNEFLCNMPRVLQGNSLFLFRFVDEHAKPIMDEMKKINPDKQIFLITGETKKDTREKLRLLAEQRDDIVFISTYSLFSTGISIKNLHNVVFASPMASKVKILQSIGRTLRLHESKDHANVYDIVDDFTGDKKKQNYALKHFMERFEIYTKEQFNIKIKEVNIGR